jgi:hypothetical protein
VETFVVRIWAAVEASGNPERLLLRGLVEHVRGGERRAFCGSPELIAFLERFAPPPPTEGGGSRCTTRIRASIALRRL